MVADYLSDGCIFLLLIFLNLNKFGVDYVMDVITAEMSIMVPIPLLPRQIDVNHGCVDS
jgi:hypothetical protein